MRFHSWRSRALLREAPNFSPPAMFTEQGTSNRVRLTRALIIGGLPHLTLQPTERQMGGPQMEPQSILTTGKAYTGGSGLYLRAGRFPMATPGADRHTAQPQGHWTQQQPQLPRSRTHVGFLWAAWLPPPQAESLAWVLPLSEHQFAALLNGVTPEPSTQSYGQG